MRLLRRIVRRTTRPLRAGVVVASIGLPACAPVAPYERGVLAHPTMTVDDMASRIDQHVRAVSEGGKGGLSGGGGGCGCN